MSKVNLIIHTRDLRVHDNKVLNKAIKESKNDNIKLIPLFIYNPDQLFGKYASKILIDFMKLCVIYLKSLYKRLLNTELITLYGTLNELFREKLTINKIYILEDYSPFARERAKKLSKYCVELVEITDSFLYDEIIEIKTNSQSYFKVFTKFYNKAKKHEIKISNLNIESNVFLSKAKCETIMKSIFSKFISSNNYSNKFEDNIEFDIDLLINGTYLESSKNGKSGKSGKSGNNNNTSLPDLRRVTFNRIKNSRNYKNKLLESNEISKFIRFGIISTREAYISSKKYNSRSIFNNFSKQLYWNNFYIYLQIHYNTIEIPLKNPNKKYRINETTRENFKKWKKGKTGIDIIDAIMNKLNNTGYISNRCRLITANYLVFKLKVDWKLGEMYFARKLIDYDIYNNNGNWAWVSGHGVDYQKRVYNPLLQQKRYDINNEFVSKWK